MRWSAMMWLLVLPAAGAAGCDEGGGGDGDAGDTGDPIVDYTCVDLDSEEYQEKLAQCGEYPEGAPDTGWDLGAVAANLKFPAYYDRDCDGVRDATELDMYRDVYCNRDQIKSIVLVAGSNCGSDPDQPCEN